MKNSSTIMMKSRKRIELFIAQSCASIRASPGARQAKALNRVAAGVTRRTKRQVCSETRLVTPAATRRRFQPRHEASNPVSLHYASRIQWFAASGAGVRLAAARQLAKRHGPG